MKVVILAGGKGTRLAEETDLIPKPMVKIGEKPIIWHIMKIYSYYGFNDFIICLGYKGHVIKEYFTNYFLYNSDLTVNLKNNSIEIHNNNSENWKVTLIDTGLDTMTGGRLKRIKKYIGNETFMVTYGDGLSDINIKKLLEFHKANNKLATLTAIEPQGRYGLLKLKDFIVEEFSEKKDHKDERINGGFFVLEPGIFDYIKDDTIRFEQEPLEQISKEGQLVAYKHDGFWMAMDKLSEKIKLNEMWNSETPPWKIWN